ncbi:Rqc2 family fibronectin-binding protein [Clostridium cellulovorans]|uniref:Rqc2 homolog RqcH n=1 Tax=Clostridium cellulovorans (strain ATCC 35296 / DSM 3052 / OCM 3 / 743B) TaxID=573061 RepID=D9SLD8_CLOC7|nr:NFACT RNA binding domain-containing protein [Clostridium cellulovorans]ADL51654.1 Fibronectin-binding A domain protein [Clostridium cellulovorans 743B]
MALDGIFLSSLIYELQNKIINGRVTKINQPEEDEIQLTIRTEDNENIKLLLSANSTYPKIHVTKITKENPMNPPMFCMILRKYLSGSKILDVSQLENDRLAIIKFKSTDEFGFNSEYSLITEIMGRHSNITLVRDRDNVIMDSIKRLSADINRYRMLMPSIEYIYPPRDSKLNPLNFSVEELSNSINNQELIFNDNFFSNIFSGLSKEISKELKIAYELHPLYDGGKFIETKDVSSLYKFLSDFFVVFKEHNYVFACYEKSNVIKGFHCINLKIYESFNKKVFSTASELIEYFYAAKDKQERLNSKSANLHRLLMTNIDRCIKKKDILSKTLLETETKDQYRLYGELLTANIYAIKPNDKEITVLDYYKEEEEYITITLDPLKSPSENIQKYFKKYNKLKMSEQMSKIQMDNNTEELEYLYSALNNLEMAETYQEIEDIKNELVNEGYIKFSKNNSSKNKKASKPLKYVSSDGYELYVGKNNIQNDYLTLKFANKHDLWFHTKNIPGSHVIIRRETLDEVPDSTILEAGNLAAFYSKGQKSSQVPVDYTEVKNVKKPSGAKAGMVIYYTNKTLYVTPKEPEINKTN